MAFVLYDAVTPEHVRPFGKAGPRKRNTRSRKSGRTRILTYTPEKKQLQIDHVRKNIKPSKGKGEVTPTVARTLVRKARARIQRAPDTDSSDKEQWSCIICCEPFDNSRPGEKWIHCVVCKKWVHEECTMGDRYFVCHNCESE